jgi:hypothetical protein
VTAGERYECRVARLLYAEGAFVRRDVAVAGDGLTVTDLDILALRFAPDLSVRRLAGECKSGAARPLDRVLWGHGVKALVGADEQFLALARPAGEDVRRVAARLGVALLDARDVRRREARWPDGAWGPHAPELAALRERVRSAARGDDDLRRAHRFLTGECWLLAPVPAVKRALGAARLLARHQSPGLPPARREAVAWLAGEALAAVTVALVRLAGEAYRAPAEVFRRRTAEHLAEGIAPYGVMQSLSREVDRYLGPLLSDLGVPPRERVATLGFLAPEPPKYADALIELAERLAREPAAAAELPRLLDWRLAEARLGAETAPPFAVSPEAESLLDLVRAFAGVAAPPPHPDHPTFGGRLCDGAPVR